MPIDRSDDAAAWLEFAMRPGVPRSAQRALLRRFGSPHAAIHARPEEVAQACRPEAARAFARGARHALVERALAWLQSPGRRLVTLADDDYPPLLLEIPDPPTLLYAIGRVELLRSPCVAIVGSRNGSARGKLFAEELAEQLSLHGVCVASGLALGIDAAAHRGALRAPGSSIAVIGTGADIAYPPDNEALSRTLAQHGCVLSEFPLGTPPEAGNFPRRNRLISGLARGVVVVEASLRSGSLITAQCALDQNRDVFAVPGSVHTELSRGCHALLRQGAMLVECAGDVLQHYALEPGESARAARVEPEPGDPVLRAMGSAPVGVDELVKLTGLEAAEVAARLASFEIDGRVTGIAGGRYQRRPGALGHAL